MSDQMMPVDPEGQVRQLMDANTALRTDFVQIDEVIRQHQDKQHTYSGGSRLERLKRVLAEYANRAADVIAGSKSFRDELLVSARALSLVVNMAGNASTHREKDARLRGVAELLETWIGQLERERFEWLGNNGRFSPVLSCDFPTRHFKERIFELEARVKELTELTAKNAEVAEGSEAGLNQLLADTKEP